MSKQNNVSSWLQSKMPDQAANLLSSARKSAKPLRAKHRQREQAVIKAVRRKLLENAAAQQELEMKAAASRKKLIEDVLQHGGPCRSPSDVKNLQACLSGKELITALKGEIKYQKVILGIPGVLKLSKTAKELVSDLSLHLSGQCSAEENVMEVEDMYRQDEEDMSNLSCRWQGEFKCQSGISWVAVYYDDQFYVGQVISIIKAESAEIKFLEQTKANAEYFRWPRADDIAVVDEETESPHVEVDMASGEEELQLETHESAAPLPTTQYLPTPKTVPKKRKRQEYDDVIEAARKRLQHPPPWSPMIVSTFLVRA
ncbi:hypothetical protein EGW08_014334 [Elysia chlorotica]|uniref:Uncharacterized protein n=1 Tax=Elysia chlorotica TaxID=188477 RepID=A0A3S1B7K8_ELYCH|nr:hypothetical protein EGW08_014334 [Elysia chlorotica]